MLSPTDMERVLESLDRRLVTVEQILPTLATRADLDRFATKEDLERFATKEDLERFATKDELGDAVEAMRRHTDMRFEDLRDDIGKVADGVAAIGATLQTHQKTLETVVTRLDRHEDLLTALVRKHGIYGEGLR